MLMRLVLLALMLITLPAVNAIDVPWPECDETTCPPDPSSLR